MSFIPVHSDCPAALFHPDDLVPTTYPGMQLTAAEARKVEEILAPHVAQRLENSEMAINGWMPVLHPIPVDSKERWEWEHARNELSDKRYIVESERAAYRSLLAAYGKGDWTTLLYSYSRPSWSTQPPNPLTKALQSFRDELDQRRKNLRMAAARRLGCTCLDDPEAAAEAKAAKEMEQAQRVGGDQAADKIHAQRVAAERAAAIDRRRWEMPKETADELASVVTTLFYDLKLSRHAVVGELVAVALEHLPEVTARLNKVKAEREAKFAEKQEPTA